MFERLTRSLANPRGGTVYCVGGVLNQTATGIYRKKESRKGGGMKLITIIILIVGVLGVGYFGLTVYSNCAGPGQGSAQYDMPEQAEATHSFYINNTGGLILSSDYDQHGQGVGERLFLLHGYWELRGKDFKFVDGDIILDENIFGEITVKRRSGK